MVGVGVVEWWGWLKREMVLGFGVDRVCFE